MKGFDSKDGSQGAWNEGWWQERRFVGTSRRSSWLYDGETNDRKFHKNELNEMLKKKKQEEEEAHDIWCCPPKEKAARKQ